MPTYEYKCKRCNHQFEAFQSMSDEPLSTCPECSGPVQRLIGGGAGIIFKGSGFYVTDSRKSGSGAKSGGSNGNGESKSDSASTEKTSDTGGEKKTESTAKSDKGAKSDKSKAS